MHISVCASTCFPISEHLYLAGDGVQRHPLYGDQQYNLPAPHFCAIGATVHSDTPSKYCMIAVLAKILRKLKPVDNMDFVFRRIRKRMKHNTGDQRPVSTSSNGTGNRIYLKNIYTEDKS